MLRTNWSPGDQHNAALIAPGKMVSKLLRLARLRLIYALELSVLMCTYFAYAYWIYSDPQGYGLTWDALNHHIYLGLVAETPRWHLDALAASSQSYQYPYLYWPVYRLSLLEMPAPYVAVVWATILWLCVVPPTWLIVHRLLPIESNRLGSSALRSIALLLALCNLPALFAAQTSSNDLLASVPVLWAISFLLTQGKSPTNCAIAAFLLGMSIAFKLSNVVFVPLLLLAFPILTLSSLISRGALLLGLVSVGAVVAYLPWGIQLYRETGNAFYPYLQPLFGG